MGPRHALAPQAPPNFEDMNVDGLAEHAGTIPRETLLCISRGSLQRYLNHGSDEDPLYIQRVQRLWWSLLSTLRDSSVVDAHMNAECNATCIFLKAASSSAILPIRAFAMSEKTWMDLFNALLTKFNGAKLKPLRQVLNTVIKILGQHDDQIRVRSIQDDVLSRMASIVLLGKPVSYFKASMVIFEAFIRSGVPVSRILVAIGRSHGSHFHQCYYDLARRGIEISRLSSTMIHHVVDESIWIFSFTAILAIADSNAQATAGTFFTSLMTTLTAYGILPASSWVELVATTMHRYPLAIEPFKKYLLPLILKLHSNQYLSLLQQVASQGPESSRLSKALPIAILGGNAGYLSDKEIGTCLQMILQEGRELSSKRVTNNFNDGRVYNVMLRHSSAAVRIQTYELIVTSIEKNRPMRSSTLQLLSENLAYLHGDTDPSNRGDISSITSAMFQRLKRGSGFHARFLARPVITDQQRTEHNNELQEHAIFIEWFIRFLENELSPNCSFARHISALRALQLLVESELPHDPSTRLTMESLHSQSMNSLLYYLQLDPFEEVRRATALLLKFFCRNGKAPSDTYLCNTADHQGVSPLAEIASLTQFPGDHRIPVNSNEEITCLLRDTDALAALTSRADHADGMGRLLSLYFILAPRRMAVVWGLLERLETALHYSDGEVSLPSTDFSVHGYLMGLKYIIEDSNFYESPDSGMSEKDLDVIIHRLLELCKDVWRAVRNDLCVDSPELSREGEATGRFDGPKDFLSYSWRALRDSSLLMQAILVSLRPRVHEALHDNTGMEHLRTMYALSFEQLSELRHRGAFSTVAQTFAQCCERFVSPPTLRAEVKGWYQDAFQILEDQSARLTRRSAGIPAILACLLIPSTSEEFNGVIERLASLARSKRAFQTPMAVDLEARLPQVHALNCLREIFTNARFKDRTLAWLIEVLKIAASSLSSGIWAIRNCGLMLFRACASRIGTAADLKTLETRELAVPNGSEATLGIALKLLDNGQHSEVESPELVFAGLDLISRIAIPTDLRIETRAEILLQLSSPIWIIREHAARLYASQVPEAEALATAIHLLTSMTLSNQNRSHAVLLCSRELLGKHVSASLPFPKAKLLQLERAFHSHLPSIQQYATPALHCAFLNIVNDYIVFKSRGRSQPQTCGLQNLQWYQQPQSLDRGGPKSNLERRCESQLLSSLGLNSCLVVLGGGYETTQTLHSIFRDVAACDLDAAAALLQDLNDHISDRNTLRLQINLYINILQENYDETILAIAMRGLSWSLERVQKGTEPLTTRQELESLTNSFMVLPYSAGRDLFNARIRGLASVLARTLCERPSVGCHDSFQPLRLWTTMLSSAAKDITEVLTRLNAAESLHCFRHCLVQRCDRIETQDKLIIFSILYDFLNDDDEEIRDLAGSTSSSILSQAIGEVESQLCPLAACYRLSDYMAKIFAGNTDFHLLALSRVMLPISIELNVLNSFPSLIWTYSVRKQLDLARQESYDLFEEEKQNLYLDDIREINIWSLVLEKISPGRLNHDVQVLVREWTLAGLRELISALPGLTSGPFGVLSKPEMITLFMRVIRMADRVLYWDSITRIIGEKPPQKLCYLIEMERLLFTAGKYPLHPQVQNALDDGIRRGQVGHEQLEKRWAASSAA